MKTRIIALLMLSLGVLAGCGQTGPLYYPDDADQATQNAPASSDEADVITIE